MNPNAIALAAAVTAAAATDLIRRFKKSNTPKNSAEFNLTPNQAQALLNVAKRLAKTNAMLEHQNDYLSGLIDQHDVPITEFDRIAMTYPFTAEK